METDTEKALALMQEQNAATREIALSISALISALQPVIEWHRQALKADFDVNADSFADWVRRAEQSVSGDARPFTTARGITFTEG